MSSKRALDLVKEHNYPITEQGTGFVTVEAPGGYRFTLLEDYSDSGRQIL